MNRRAEVPGQGKPVEIVERPIPAPPSEGLIVKIHYAGVCHTDVHIWEGYFKISEEKKCMLEEFPGVEYPFNLGHEISGEVFAIGEKCSGNLSVGDRVSVFPWQGCDEASCDDCRHGFSPLCLKRGIYNLGLLEGGCQEYVSVRYGRYALPVPSGVPMDSASLLPCSGVTTYNAIREITQSIKDAVLRRDSAALLIIGAGGLGLWAIQWAKVLLPPGAKVYVADVTAEKLEIAKKYGAHDTILWDPKANDEEAAEMTRQKTGGGIDAAIDFVGLASTLQRAVEAALFNATIAVVGLLGGEARIPTFDLINKTITLKGLRVGTVGQLQEAIGLFKEKKMQAPPMKHIKLEDLQDTLDDLLKGKVSGRHVIKFA